MKLIDADALITELEKDESQFDKEAEEARNNPSAYTDGYADAMWSRANGIRDAMIEIYDAPSIDICFCKDCKKANTEDCSHSYWDDDWGEWRVGYKGDDWFCADGEREGE